MQRDVETAAILQFRGWQHGGACCPAGDGEGVAKIVDEFLAKHLFGGFAVYITRDSKHVATVLGVSHDDAHAIIAGNETAVRLDIAWYVDRLAIAVCQI